MIKKNKTEFTNGNQMEEVKHNRLSYSPFQALTAGTRQQKDPRSSATPYSLIYYPEFDGSVQYKTPRAFTLPTNPAVYFIHDFRGILYIGEAKNLRQRFLQHHRREDNQKLINLIQVVQYLDLFGNLIG